ncbi:MULTISPECIES: DUF1906 domain-containing protein [unclassified Streptomyces]|uniref:DUF1906 domain-containing protein n=1 Tax=unclassified Streptomyces TaxID=2593676 RepID=UPI003822EBE7
MDNEPPRTVNADPTRAPGPDEPRRTRGAGPARTGHADVPRTGNPDPARVSAPAPTGVPEPGAPPPDRARPPTSPEPPAPTRPPSGRPASSRVRALAAALVTVLAGAALLSGPAPASAVREGAGSGPARPPVVPPVYDARAALAPPAHGTPASPVRGAVAADHFTGRAFDTCEAPPLATMRAWQDSPYGAVGIYFGGRGRGCPGQRELDRTWVTEVHTMGWRLLPIFVGSQAPCVLSAAKRPFALGSDPWGQGTREAGDAVRAARALGLDAGSPLYLDIESYRSGDAHCAATTLSFVRAWNREVRRLGHLAGFYSSADSGVRDIEAQRRAGTADLPDVIWFARWRGGPALYTENVLDPHAWPHARIHQYEGDVAETYGGHRLVIDRDEVDAPVARITPAARLTVREHRADPVPDRVHADPGTGPEREHTESVPVPDRGSGGDRSRPSP